MAKQKTLDDFKRWFDRHVRKWRWQERSPSPDAESLGHQTEGAAKTRGLANAQIRMELQRRQEDGAQASA